MNEENKLKFEKCIVSILEYHASPTSSNEFKRINSEWLWICAKITLPKRVFNSLIP